MAVRQDGGMSPLSRGRKKAKSRRSVQRVLNPVAEVPEECDCPACSDMRNDPAAFIEDLTAGAADVLTVDDPLEAELFGASFVAAGGLAGEGFPEALSEGIVPALAQLSTPESLGVLLAIDSVESGARAGDAARRLLEAGVPAPAWMRELSEPVKVGPCRHYADPAGEASMLLCSFERAGRSHGFIVRVDHLDCAAAADIMLFPGEMLDQVSRMIQADARRAGVPVTAEELDPAEFRWQIERALDARAVHDRDDGGPNLDDDLGDEDGPGYHPLAVLLRVRMDVLPEPSRPPAAHSGSDRAAALEVLAQLAEVVRQVQDQGRPARTRTPRLRAKRKKSDGPAPIYQIKISLRDAKPPIWRRLELPGDTSLAELHHIIQAAFGWEDSHLHVFDTPYGAFGVADRDLGHRAERPVTLEQVASGVGDKVRYLYDFGDNWEHDIVVEKLLERQAVAYPRCTGGRRAAPPEDCGGIGGYTELVEILRDTTHPEHAEQLEWLGLRSAEDFEPARFDAAKVTRTLTDKG